MPFCDVSDRQDSRVETPRSSQISADCWNSNDITRPTATRPLDDAQASSVISSELGRDIYGEHDQHHHHHHHEQQSDSPTVNTGTGNGSDSNSPPATDTPHVDCGTGNGFNNTPDAGSDNSNSGGGGSGFLRSIENTLEDIFGHSPFANLLPQLEFGFNLTMGDNNGSNNSSADNSSSNSGSPFLPFPSLDNLPQPPIPSPGDITNLVDNLPKPPLPFPGGELPGLSGNFPQPPSPSDLFNVVDQLPKPPLPTPNDLNNLAQNLPKSPNPLDVISSLPKPPGLPDPESIFNPFKLFS